VACTDLISLRVCLCAAEEPHARPCCAAGGALDRADGRYPRRIVCYTLTVVSQPIPSQQRVRVFRQGETMGRCTAGCAYVLRLPAGAARSWMRKRSGGSTSTPTRYHPSWRLPTDITALEATQGQMDGFFSQLPYKCHQNRVASVGCWLTICPWVTSRVACFFISMRCRVRVQGSELKWRWRCRYRTPIGRGARSCSPTLCLIQTEREFFIDNLMVRIHFIVVMIRWTGLARWECEFPFPGSFTSRHTNC